MSKTVTVVDTYPADLERTWAMLTDRAYAEEKYSELGFTDVDFLEWRHSDTGGFRLKVKRKAPVQVPGFLSKVVKDSTLIQTDEWEPVTGAGRGGSTNIETPGAPLTVTGTLAMTEADGQTTLTVAMTLKASVPLIGGRIEEYLADMSTKTVNAENTFNKQWLATH